MLRMVRFLLFVMAASLLTTAIVHARELGGPVTVECSGTVHRDGDADQSPGDADDTTPHHHGTCSGPSLDLPSAHALSSVPRPGSIRPAVARDAALASRVTDPALRPPAA